MENFRCCFFWLVGFSSVFPWGLISVVFGVVTSTEVRMNPFVIWESWGRPVVGSVPLDVRINCQDHQVISPQETLAFKWVTKDFEFYGTSYLMNDINECVCFQEYKMFKWHGRRFGTRWWMMNWLCIWSRRRWMIHRIHKNTIFSGWNMKTISLREGNEVMLSRCIQAYHDPTLDFNKQIEQIQMTSFIRAILPKTCAVVVWCSQQEILERSRIWFRNPFKIIRNSWFFGLQDKGWIVDIGADVLNVFLCKC